jgi:hypothetical protein
MEGKEKRPEVYEREKLHAEVWDEPVMIVAQRYGVSDVTLAKTCRRMAIPLPGRGYWARLRAGQKLKRPPLPSPPAGVPQTLTVYRALLPTQERETRPETAARNSLPPTSRSRIRSNGTSLKPMPLSKSARPSGTRSERDAISTISGLRSRHCHPMRTMSSPASSPT